MQRFQTYSDIDLTFNAHPATGDVIRKTGASAILQSIQNLVRTAENEFVMDLDVYGGVNKFLFKNNTQLSLIRLKGRIEEIVKLHEPRAELKSVEVLTSEDDRHAVSVTVIFYALNLPDPFTETIKLDRVR